LQIELVLTAHPTETARRTLVQKYNRIAAALAAQDRLDLTLVEREELVDNLKREIETAWASSEIRSQRPSPLDEVRSGLVILEQSLSDALPRHFRNIDHGRFSSRELSA
jgi:phosphoenolpyruvate carboxylase